MNTGENKKKSAARIRVTPLDLALVLLVVLIVVSIWQKNNIQHLFEKQKQERSYAVTFELAGMRVPSAELIKEGMPLYFYDGDERMELGNLSGGPLLTPYTQIYTNTNGETVTMVYPTDDRENGRVTLCGTFVCHGAQSDLVLVHEEGLRLQVGNPFTLSTELGDFEAIVVSITEIER